LPWGHADVGQGVSVRRGSVRSGFHLGSFIRRDGDTPGRQIWRHGPARAPLGVGSGRSMVFWTDVSHLVPNREGLGVAAIPTDRHRVGMRHRKQMVSDTPPISLRNGGIRGFVRGRNEGVLRTLLAGSSSRNALHGPVCGEQLIGMDSGTTKTRPTGTFWETTRHLRETTVYGRHYHSRRAD
jgi:hypothetical protein